MRFVLCKHSVGLFAFASFRVGFSAVEKDDTKANRRKKGTGIN